jgi:hypothetical protein
MTKIRVVMLSVAKSLPEICSLQKGNGRTLQRKRRMTKIRVVMLSPAKHLPEVCSWTKNGASRLAKTSRELSAVVASIFCEAICLFCCHVERSEVSLC